MRIKLVSIIFMIIPVISVKTLPAQSHIQPQNFKNDNQKINTAQLIPKPEIKSEEGRVISVRITSSVAVGRGISYEKSTYETLDTNEHTTIEPIATTAADITDTFPTASNFEFITNTFQTTEAVTEIPPHLVGANVEFIKQLQAKKESRASLASEPAYQLLESSYDQSNDTQDFLSQHKISKVQGNDELNEDVPIGRSIPRSYSSKSLVNVQGPINQKFTTVSFNIVHDSPKSPNYNDQGSSDYKNRSGAPVENIYNEPLKIYSEPAQIYSEPAKFYSEPAKVYSEPSKIYSEPAKVYSEPAKIYSEPAKFYSKPASLHFSQEAMQANRNQWSPQTGTSHTNTTPSQQIRSYSTNERVDHQPEKNYEVDEKVSVMTDGRSHGEQSNNPENCKQENCKVGYVVEGRQFRKYRVEERTSDGFIVGEYGVVRNEDGALRGVRYTADSEASPRLIHDALMKFLQLK